jgi:hypothetical protein
VIAVVTASRSSGPLWRRLCRLLCREQGGKDAAMVAILAIVIGALALQLAIGQAGRPASREAPASLRA